MYLYKYCIIYIVLTCMIVGIKLNALVLKGTARNGTFADFKAASFWSIPILIIVILLEICFNVRAKNCSSKNETK